MAEKPAQRQVNPMSELTRKLQEQSTQQWQKANEELQRILKELGADNTEEQSLSGMIRDIREKNPSFRDLMLSLDAATYDARKKFSWNAHMTSAYVLNKVEASYTNDLKPMIENYRQQAFDRLQALIAQLRSARARFVAAARDTENEHSQNG